MIMMSLSELERSAGKPDSWHLCGCYEPLSKHSTMGITTTQKLSRAPRRTAKSPRRWPNLQTPKIPIQSNLIHKLLTRKHKGPKGSWSVPPRSSTETPNTRQVALMYKIWAYSDHFWDYISVLRHYKSSVAWFRFTTPRVQIQQKTKEAERVPFKSDIR